ncbi:hypothetical protein KUTeg_020969 [Tegillarca granosa]|uniref:CXXC-type zinc finger protein 1 n=1 Tax=Tegillarca granosa TaxID=220873 RepID=A0ABQ9EDL1_TEGGR|nr:hypothetical protein KUTeg_020969 [Tegillarca granosa]
MDDEEIQYCICRSTDCNRFMIGCDNCEEWYHGDCIGVTEKDAKSIKQFFCEACRKKNPLLEIKYKTKKTFKEKSTKHHIDHEREMRHRDWAHRDKDKGRKKSTRRCGECVNCHKTEDCGRCDFCKDMKKFGGPNKIRQKCRLRQCINFGLNTAVTGKKGDQESECTVTTETESFRTEYSGRLLSDGDDDDRDDDDFDFDDSFDASENIKKSPKRKGRRKNSTESGSPRKKYKKIKNKHSPTKKKQKSKEKTSSERKRKHIEADEPIEVEEEQPRQCYGPGCISAARNNSKYCSDECGMKLAKNRIYELLPPKIQQWQSSPCVTEENNKKMLEKIRRQQLEARQKLGELDIRQQELDALIERAKHATVSHDQDATDEYDDTELYCVTCGVEVNQKAALKHMEKCFAKYEAQTSFGSIYKTRIEGNSMFCDYYNSQQKTYCKRLKVLCPEHTKEPKVSHLNR